MSSSSSPLPDADDEDPFKDETPPWLLRRGESIIAGEDDDDRRRNPEQPSTSTSTSTPAPPPPPPPPTSLLDLNRDCLITILSSLPPPSIASAALSCSLLADVAKEDALWRLKALEDFGSRTTVDAWTRRGVAEGRRERRRRRRRRKKKKETKEEEEEEEEEELEEEEAMTAKAQR